MKRALSWLVWIVGVGLSVFAFAALGVRAWPGQEASVKQWLDFIGFGLCAALMVGASLFALRRRRWAGILLIAASLPVPALLLMSADSSLTLGQRLPVPAIVAATLCAPGAFWVLTGRSKWPALISSITCKGRTIALIVAGVGVYAVAVVCTVTLFVLNAPEPVGDCFKETRPLRVRPLYPAHSVFTARIVRIGRRRDWDPKEGRWALTRVEENFWGAPKYSGGYVIVFGGSFGEREEWLIDAFRYDGIISGHLPIVQTLICGRSRAIQIAETDLRVLRDQEGWKGGRIVGTAQKDRITRAPGAKIVIHGPVGEIKTTTDAQGIYDVKGLPPGRYSVQAESPDPAYFDRGEQFDLKDGEAWGRAVYVSE